MACASWTLLLILLLLVLLVLLLALVSRSLGISHCRSLGKHGGVGRHYRISRPAVVAIRMAHFESELETLTVLLGMAIASIVRVFALLECSGTLKVAWRAIVPVTRPLSEACTVSPLVALSEDRPGGGLQGRGFGRPPRLRVGGG
jgi:hypothetical protein